MNQTGDIGKKMQTQGGTMRATGLDPNQVQLEINPYAEEPRPNLYNIVKNIRENKVKDCCFMSQVAYMRILYVAKNNETEVKGDVESINTRV